MDKNTFWSHTAQSYELIDDSDTARTNILDRDTDISTIYHIITVDDEIEEPFIEVRVFRTAEVEVKDRRERKFHWLNRKK